MKKRILFIGYNFRQNLRELVKYSGEMMEWMANYGHDCTVLTAYPYYPQWQVQEPYRKNRFWYTTEKKTYPSGGSLTIKRCPMYVPNKPTGAKRMLLDTSFSITAFLAMLPTLFAEKKGLGYQCRPILSIWAIGCFL